MLIAHPGGPFFARRHEGVWSLPKGLLENGESPVEAAEREFAEETGFAVPEGERVSLGQVRMRSGKVVHGWAVCGDADPGALDPGTFLLEWPPGSGRMVDTPEIDEVRWVTPDPSIGPVTGRSASLRDSTPQDRRPSTRS